MTVMLPREPVTVAQIAQQLGIPVAVGALSRKDVRRLARAAWEARRAGLLVEDDGRGMPSPRRAHAS